MSEIEKIEPGFVAPESGQFITAERLEQMIPKGCATAVTEDILKIIAMDREETIKTFESYQNKSENKTMY